VLVASRIRNGKNSAAEFLTNKRRNYGKGRARSPTVKEGCVGDERGPKSRRSRVSAMKKRAPKETVHIFRGRGGRQQKGMKKGNLKRKRRP